MQDSLPLRDIHQPPSPPLWPPAPGWWIVVAALLIAGACWWWWRRGRMRRRIAIAQLFDAQVDAAQTPALKIAAMSALLRRASRKVDPAADKLQGDAWLAFLDRGSRMPVFAAGAGAALRDGAFRRDVSDIEFEALHAVARDRFVRWMERSR